MATIAVSTLPWLRIRGRMTDPAMPVLPSIVGRQAGAAAMAAGIGVTPDPAALAFHAGGRVEGGSGVAPRG